jgi:hypothetical protein
MEYLCENFSKLYISKITYNKWKLVEKYGDLIPKNRIYEIFSENEYLMEETEEELEKMYWIQNFIERMKMKGVNKKMSRFYLKKCKYDFDLAEQLCNDYISYNINLYEN